MSIPLYGFLQGDTIGLLIMAEPEDKVITLASKLREAASVRVAPLSNVRLIYNGTVIDPELTVKEVGLQALERFDVLQGDD